MNKIICQGEFRTVEIIHEEIYKNHKFIITHTDELNYNWHCGYVEVKKEHPYFDVDYENLDNIECHGGLTYSGYLFKKKLNDNNYYIGFDTNHFDSFEANNLNSCIKECKNIIEQLIKIKN